MVYHGERTFVPIDGGADTGFVAANDSALLQLVFKNGAHGTIRAGGVSASSPGGKHYRIEGDLATLEVDQNYFKPLSQVRLGKLGAEMERVAVPSEFCGGLTEPSSLDEFLRFMTTQSVGTRGFIDGILEGRQVTPSFADGLAVQRIMDAAQRASESRTWISMPSA